MKITRGNIWKFKITRSGAWKFKVSKITDRTVPVLQSAIVPADGLTLALTYDKVLDTNSVPVVSDFDIGLLSGVVVDAVTISGAVVTLTLSRTILTGETLTVGYTAGSNPIQDDYGNQAANLIGQEVTNNSTTTVYSTEYQRVYDYFGVIGVQPSDSVASFQDAMVEGWVASGVWAKSNVRYVLAGHTNDNEESLVNWKNPGTYDAVIVLNGGTMNFTAFEGFQSDDGAYINTGFAPSDGTLTLDDASCGVYVMTNVNEDAYDIGSYESGSTIFQIASRRSGNFEGFINSGSNSEIATADSRGYSIVNRESSASIQIYKNGGVVNSTARVSNTVGTVPFYILARRLGGIVSSNSTKQIASAFVGLSMTAEQIASDTEDFEAYMDSNGKGVIFPEDGEVIPLIVGETTLLYGDQLGVPDIGDSIDADYDCAIGSTSGNNYSITPIIGDAGANVIDIRVLVDGVVIRKSRSELSVVDKTNTGTKTITMVGDSLVDRGGDDELVALRAVFNSMTWTGIGLTGIAPNLREGYSGKTYDWLVNEADSPFTKAGVVDVPAYYTDNGLSVPDFIYLRMGVNTAASDTFDEWSEADQNLWLGYIEELIDAFLAHDANVNIIVGCPSNSESSGDGWFASYGTTRSQDGYDDKIDTMRNLITANYGNADYNARVFVAYAPYVLDRDDGYPKVDGVHTNGVHPDASGYEQLGQGMASTINTLL